MRIAINTRLLLKGKMDGIGWFTAETARHMVLSHPEHQFFFFFDRKPDPEFIFADNVTPVILHPQARHPVLWYIYFEWSTVRALKKYNIDLYLSPDGMIPLHLKIPTLAVIHDLNFEHSKGNLKWYHQYYLSYYYPRFARKATRIATVSTYSKDDIAKTYCIDSMKIDVVYDGAHSNYRPHTDIEKHAIREKFTDGCPYLIFISTIIKRKNLANLLRAFDMVKQQGGREKLKLVVVGSRVWWQDELAEAYDSLSCKEDVIMPGHVDSEKLAALLSAAEMLVYPSYFEGFGIPILEAMHAETPVVASKTTSMPEVGGDAALYIDPTSPEDIAHAINELDNLTLRAQLIEKGRRQRQKYSWEITSNLLWDSLMKTLKKS